MILEMKYINELYKKFTLFVSVNYYYKKLNL